MVSFLKHSRTPLYDHFVKIWVLWAAWSYSGIPIFLTFKENEDWVEKSGYKQNKNNLTEV